VLAERGWRVTLIEKDRHPRFHIGESLLPHNLALFERLGVAEDIAAIGMVKHGAEFVSAEHGRSVTFEFADALEKSRPYAYQVRRSEFDHLLLKNAAAKGATVVEGMRAKKVEFLPDRTSHVEALDEEGRTHRWHPRFLIDATGRDTLLANRFGIKQRNRRHNSAALFGHFSGARRLQGDAEGNISIFWFAHGWFWFIPLRDGITSVGAVCWPYYMKSRRSSPEQFLHETIALCPGVAERLREAKLESPVTATGNYSYQASSMVGPGYVMIGDAFAFIDPVFSTGVFLAMKSAMLAVDAVDAALRSPAQAERLFSRFDRRVRRSLAIYSWYIYRVTSPAMRGLLMSPKNVMRVQEALVSLLAGDDQTPGVMARLRVFKLIYYIASILNLRACLRAFRSRRRAIRGSGSGAAAAGA
jgi:flavin-dependent dehydrogenase